MRPYNPGGAGGAASPAGPAGPSGPGSGGGRAGAGPAGRIQELLAELVAALAADPELVARIHAPADVDASPQALHHTLGEGNTQAAAGSHLHDERYSRSTHTHDLDDLTDLAKSWSNEVSSATSTTAAETKDAGSLEFTAKAGRRYEFRWNPRVNTSVVTTTDLRIRGRTYTGSVPLLSTSDTLLGACTVGSVAAGAGGTAPFLGSAPLVFSLECPAQLAAGQWTVAGFWDTTGTGTSLLDQATGATRQLEVTEKLQAD